jgi:hypothetical protein
LARVRRESKKVSIVSRKRNKRRRDERRSEDVHRSTLSVTHTINATEELSKNTLDRSTTENGEGVAAVGGDDLVLGDDGVVHTDRDGLLRIVEGKWEEKVSKERGEERERGRT